MIPLAFVIAVATASLLVLVVAVISLARQMRRVVASIADFQQELEPILREIQTDADRATQRLVRLQQEGMMAAPSDRRRVVSVDPDAPSLPG